MSGAPQELEVLRNNKAVYYASACVHCGACDVGLIGLRFTSDGMKCDETVCAKCYAPMTLRKEEL